ncbi:hypothetical protein [Pseudomonas sp.]|uniref:hypothetical protein n=1 Tax=Pseudomonas sp. TaxID=306 RepID=UPI0025830FEA|nr:hypothetical protein [Pseudomonas sp.]
MTPEDITYLQAELAMAQKEGLKATMVRIPELQSLLDRLARAVAAAPPDVSIFGFVRPGEAKDFRSGTLASLRVRRSITEWHTEPLFIGVKA